MEKIKICENNPISPCLLNKEKKKMENERVKFFLLMHKIVIYFENLRIKLVFKKNKDLKTKNKGLV